MHAYICQQIHWFDNVVEDEGNVLLPYLSLSVWPEADPGVQVSKGIHAPKAIL